MRQTIAAAIMAAVIVAGKPAFGEDTMLIIGKNAPDFSLPSSTGDTIKLADFQGKKYVVLIFYPGDQTPGCTKQLCAIRDDYSQFEKKNAVVFGVNPADKESHKAFAAKQHYQFPLLVDKGKMVAAKYGAGGIMVRRTVYVIDKEGKIAFAQRGMPSDAEILASIKADGE